MSLNSIRLSLNAVNYFCVGKYWPILRPEFKEELLASGYDLPIVFVHNGSWHFQFMTDDQAVMFRLTYSEYL